MSVRWVLFVSMVGCSGVGRPPPVPLQRAPSASSGAQPPAYHRREWRHWIDADHDCQDTRQEVLIAESEVPVEFADARHCRVKLGRWTCPYTGQTVTDPAELDIDHLVPLENAHRSGGWRWSPKRKREYANGLQDPEHLLAVTASANRAKGSKVPGAWLPSNKQFTCGYLAAWVRIKRQWALSMVSDEAAASQRILADCGSR